MKSNRHHSIWLKIFIPPILIFLLLSGFIIGGVVMTVLEDQKSIDLVEQVVTAQGDFKLDDSEAYKIRSEVSFTGVNDKNGQPVLALPDQRGWIKLDKITVGSFRSNENGVISGKYTIPNLPASLYVLRFNVQNDLGQRMALYQQVFIYVSDIDLDGDGQQNNLEECGIIEPSGQDEDKDGIDDACDGIIGS